MGISRHKQVIDRLSTFRNRLLHFLILHSDYAPNFLPHFGCVVLGGGRVSASEKAAHAAIDAVSWRCTGLPLTRTQRVALGEVARVIGEHDLYAAILLPSGLRVVGCNRVGLTETARLVQHSALLYVEVFQLR